MLKANEAREIAKTSKNGIVQRRLAEIEKKIKEAAENGQTSINTEYLSDLVMKELESLGYKVERESGDWRDPGFSRINW